MTPDTLRRLAELSLMLDRATDDYRRLDEAAVRAKAAYEVSYARVYLMGDGKPVEARKQRAVLSTADERLEWELAQAKVRAVTERIRTLRSQIEVGRSLNAAYRTEFAAGSSIT